MLSSVSRRFATKKLTNSEAVRTINSTRCQSPRPAVRCKIHGQTCPKNEECWMVDKEDDWTDDTCIQSHANSFSIHEACFEILLQCRRYRGVNISDQGKEFDQFINDLGSTLKAYDRRKSWGGCRVDTPWYARRDDFDVVLQRPEPVVRFRMGGKWVVDKDNRLFQDPETTVTLKSTHHSRQTKSLNLSLKRNLHDHNVDPFAKLPEELLTEILTWLPSEDAAALRLSSPAMSQVHLSARFWYSRLNAPEMQMMLPRNVRAIGSEKKDKKDLVCSILRFGLSRTRIAMMAYEVLWYVSICGTIREVGVDKPRWLWGNSIKAPPKAHAALQSRKIPLTPEWFSAVGFDNKTPFSTFKKLTMFFHTPRRYFHHPGHGLGNIEHDRYLTGIRFENGQYSKDLGHCHGQDIMHVELPDAERFESLTLRIDTNNSVSVQSLCSTDGNLLIKHEIYWSRFTRPFRARFEEIKFVDSQVIEMGLTRECRMVVFDVLVPDLNSINILQRKRRRLY